MAGPILLLDLSQPSGANQMPKSCVRFPTCLATSDPSAVSIFTYPLDNNGANYTFAINIPDDSTDIYFHLAAPSFYSWVAVGTGSEMANSLMILTYADASGQNVTVSPRLSTGEREPVFAPSLDVEILPGSGILDGSLTVNGRCSNCTTWATGSLDLRSTLEPWIYALGPSSDTTELIQSDDKSPSIERHSAYGQFTMDMVRATGGSGGLPDSYPDSSIGAYIDGGMVSDSNWPSIIHGILACGAIAFLMPLGVIFLRVAPGSVTWHWINQSIAIVLAVIGIGVGFYLSPMFNKSQSFRSSHQVLGIAVGVLAIVQWVLGAWHHRVYSRTKSRTAYGVLHRWLGAIVVPFAVVNGGIGLTWARAARGRVIWYSVAVVVFLVGVTAVVVWRRWSAKLKPGQGGYLHEPFRFDESQQGLPPGMYMEEYYQRPPPPYMPPERI